LAGISQFTTQEQSTTGGHLTTIGASPTVTVLAGTPSQLVFTTSALSGATSSSANLGPATVALEDAFGNLAPAGLGGFSVSLGASPSPGAVFSASLNGASTSSVTIAQGSTTTSFYFGDSATGSVTITASGSGVLSATQGATVSAPPAPFAADGTGTITASVATGTVTTGSIVNTIIFTYTAASGGINNGELDIEVPQSWSAPNGSTSAGCTTESGGGATLSFNGQTIRVTNLTLGSVQTATITYGASSCGGLATAQPTRGLATFITSEKSTSTGNLRSIAKQPAVSVELSPTVTSLSSSVASSIVVGQRVTYTASVGAGPERTPTGTVSFFDGKSTLCSSAYLSSGSASCTYRFTNVGSQMITAVYSGNDTFATSTSAALEQVVNKASTTITSSQAAAAVKVTAGMNSVTFLYTLKTTPPGSGMPTGKVTVSRDGDDAVVCQEDLSTAMSNGQGSCYFDPEEAGTFTFTARYSGDHNFLASSSGTVRVTVVSPTFTITYHLLTSAGTRAIGSPPARWSGNTGTATASDVGGLSLVGYFLAGWCTTDTAKDPTLCDGVHYNVGDHIPVNSDLDLYSQWKPAGFNVIYARPDHTTYSIAGKPPADSANPYADSSTVTVLSLEHGQVGRALFVPTGHRVFAGWCTSSPVGDAATCPGTLYHPGDTFTIHSDVTLYADFQPIITVTYSAKASDGEQTTGSPPASMETTDSSYTANGPTLQLADNSGSDPLALTGYTFAGWCSTGTAKNPTLCDGTHYDVGTVTLTGDTTLYSQWKAVAASTTTTATTTTVAATTTTTTAPVATSCGPQSNELCVTVPVGQTGSFNVGGFRPGASVTVSVNGSPVALVRADSKGFVSFTVTVTDPHIAINHGKKIAVGFGANRVTMTNGGTTKSLIVHIPTAMRATASSVWNWLTWLLVGLGVLALAIVGVLRSRRRPPATA
jgi:hypothetical protein